MSLSLVDISKFFCLVEVSITSNLLSEQITAFHCEAVVIAMAIKLNLEPN